MAVADGRKSIQEVRNATAQRVRALRASRGSSLRNEEEDHPEGPSSSLATALYGARSLPLGPPTSDGKSNLLIDVLAGSDAATRGAAVDALITGARHSQFEAVTNAVVDLYQRLSRAGR